MDGKDIVKKYDEDANRLVSMALRYLFVFVLILEISSLIGVFRIETNVMIAAVLISSVVFIVPTILIDVYDLKGKWLPYVILSLLCIMTGVLYTLLSYHVILLFTVPCAVSCIYNRTNYARFTAAFSIPVIVVSHLLSGVFRLVPDEPLVEVDDIIKYGIIPRLLEFLAFAFICYLVTSHTRGLIMELISQADTENRRAIGLDTIISESDGLYSSRNYRQLASIALVSVFGIISSLVSDEENNVRGLTGIRTGKSEFYVINDIFSELENAYKIDKESLKVVVDGINITLPLVCDKPERAPQYAKGCLVMAFYNDCDLIGFLIIGKNFGENDSELLNIFKIMYNNIETAMTNVLVNNDIFETQSRLVFSFAEIAEEKSGFKNGHIIRVAEYMRIMATYCGLPEQECDNIYIASMLHDIGRLSIPTEIFKNPKPTQEEQEIIKHHTIYGKELLQNCPGRIMEIACDIAFQHHERWDGSGYLGFSGDGIRRHARYCAVANCFDELVIKGMEPRAAADIIDMERGTGYYPEAVDVFDACFDSICAVLRKYPTSVDIDENDDLMV